MTEIELDPKLFEQLAAGKEVTLKFKLKLKKPDDEHVAAAKPEPASGLKVSRRRGRRTSMDTVQKGYELFKDSGLQMNEIADQCGVTAATISTWRKKYWEPWLTAESKESENDEDSIATAPTTASDTTASVSSDATTKPRRRRRGTTSTGLDSGSNEGDQLKEKLFPIEDSDISPELRAELAALDKEDIDLIAGQEVEV